MDEAWITTDEVERDTRAPAGPHHDTWSKPKLHDELRGVVGVQLYRALRYLAERTARVASPVICDAAELGREPPHLIGPNDRITTHAMNSIDCPTPTSSQ
jgi:hypothetical protein